MQRDQVLCYTPQDRRGVSPALTGICGGEKAPIAGCVMGGNQQSENRTLSCFELTCHLLGPVSAMVEAATVFTRPIRAWCASDTLITLRDVLAEKLVGPPHARGSAMIPKDAIKSLRPKSGRSRWRGHLQGSSIPVAV